MTLLFQSAVQFSGQALADFPVSQGLPVLKQGAILPLQSPGQEPKHPPPLFLQPQRSLLPDEKLSLCVLLLLLQLLPFLLRWARPNAQPPARIQILFYSPLLLLLRAIGHLLPRVAGGLARQLPRHPALRCHARHHIGRPADLPSPLPVRQKQLPSSGLKIYLF